MLLLSVNQTILFALSMVVIAGLIGGKGLGDVVTSGLNSYPALALLAGIVIVVMAMALDRVTEAVAERTNPAKRHLTDELRRRLRIASAVTAVAIIATVAVARALGVGAVYSRTTARDWLLARLQSMLDYVQNPDTLLFRVTSWIGDHIVQYGLVPFRNFLVETPWPVTLIGITLISLVVSGRRSAITTFLMLALIGVIGEWSSAMDTASQVLVATVLTVVIGVGLGVWAAESRTFSRILRPVNDVLQTLPQLVYLIPLIYLMPVSVVPGVIAGVLYAFPVVARLVESGVRNVEANTVEAAAAFGATRQADPDQGEDPARPGRDHARRQPGDHHGARRRRDRRPRRLARARLRGRAGARAVRLRARCACIARHTCAGYRARPGHAGSPAEPTRRSRLTSVDEKQRTSSAFPNQPRGKEGRMSRRRWSRRWVVAAMAIAAVSALAVSASALAGSSSKSAASAGCGTVTLNENAWAGSTANVYVLKYVLEKKLGCKVNMTKLPESTPLFQAMADGKIDVVPEDWNNLDLKVTRSTSSSHTIRAARLERCDRADRLVHPDVPDEAVSRVQDVAGPEGQGERLQVPGVRARRACSSAATRPTSRRTRS